MTTFEKDADANLEYKWDYDSWLTSGDTITAHTVAATGGLVIGAHSHDATSVTVWLSGGTVNTLAQATVHITTAQGRIDDRTFFFDVKQR